MCICDFLCEGGIHKIGDCVAVYSSISLMGFTPEQTKEAFDVARNSIELLSTVLSSSLQQDVLEDDLGLYQPHLTVSVPLVFEALYSGIMKQISTSSLIRKHVALTFVRVSLRYMACKRVYEGKCLTKNQKSPSYLYTMLDWLWARSMAAILYPVHMLANKLVYSKIRSTIGISSVLYIVQLLHVIWKCITFLFTIIETFCRLLLQLFSMKEQMEEDGMGSKKMEGAFCKAKRGGTTQAAASTSLFQRDNNFFSFKAGSSSSSQSPGGGFYGRANVFLAPSIVHVQSNSYAPRQPQPPSNPSTSSFSQNHLPPPPGPGFSTVVESDQYMHTGLSLVRSRNRRRGGNTILTSTSLRDQVFSALQIASAQRWLHTGRGCIRFMGFICELPQHNLASNSWQCSRTRRSNHFRFQEQAFL